MDQVYSVENPLPFAVRSILLVGVVDTEYFYQVHVLSFNDKTRESKMNKRLKAVHLDATIFSLMNNDKRYKNLLTH